MILPSIWQCHFPWHSWWHKLPPSLQRLCISGFCWGWHFVSNTIGLCLHHPQPLTPLLAGGAHRPWAASAVWPWYAAEQDETPASPVSSGKLSLPTSALQKWGGHTLQEDLYGSVLLWHRSEEGQQLNSQCLPWKIKSSSGKQFTVSVVLGLPGLLCLYFHPKQMMCLIKRRIQAIVNTFLLKSSHLES